MEILDLLSFVEFIGDIHPEVVDCNLNSNYGFSRCLGRGLNLTQIKHKLCSSKYASIDEFIVDLRIPFIQRIQFFKDQSREFDVLDEISSHFEVVRFLEFKQTRQMLSMFINNESTVIQSMMFPAKWSFQSGPMPTICISDLVFKLEQNMIKSYEEFKLFMSQMFFEYTLLFEYEKNAHSKNVLVQLIDFFKHDINEEEENEDFEFPPCLSLSSELRRVVSESLLESFWQKSDLTLSFESWKHHHNDSKSEDILFKAWSSSQPIFIMNAHSKSFNDVSRKRFNQELETIESRILRSPNFKSGKGCRFNHFVQKYKSVDWIKSYLFPSLSSTLLDNFDQSHQFHFFRRLYAIFDLEFERNQHLCGGDFDRYLKKRKFDFGCLLRNEFEHVSSKVKLGEFLRQKIQTLEDIEFKQFCEDCDYPESEHLERFKTYLLEFETDNEL